jgi:hypothetical protein
MNLIFLFGKFTKKQAYKFMKRLYFGILMLKRKNGEETKAGTYEYKV